MIDKFFIISSIISIIIGIIFLYFSYDFFNKEYSQNPIDKEKNWRDEANYKFLAKILGTCGLLFICVPIFIYYTETHPEFLQSNSNSNTRPRYSTNTSTQAFKLFF